MISEEYLSLVRLVAERIHRRLPPGVDLESLVHAGIAGLLRATAHYPTLRGGLFQSYARYRVQGEIAAYLRSLDWVSHAVRAWGRRVMTVRTSLAGRLNREATAAEIAAELGISAEDYRRCHPQVGDTVLLSLEELSLAVEDEWKKAQEQFTSHPSEDPLHFLPDKSLVAMLSKTVGELSEQHRLVLALSHYEGLTPREIGEILDLTEEDICQIERQITDHLRQTLRQRPGPDV